MKRSWILLVAIILCAGLIGGCATADAISSVRAQIKKAKDAGADWSAPYECYMAEEYLKRAVHEAEEGSPREDVDRFLNVARENAQKALASVGGAK